jgi:hypothetical protein
MRAPIFFLATHRFRNRQKWFSFGSQVETPWSGVLQHPKTLRELYIEITSPRSVHISAAGKATSRLVAEGRHDTHFMWRRRSAGKGNLYDAFEVCSLLV